MFLLWFCIVLCCWRQVCHALCLSAARLLAASTAAWACAPTAACRWARRERRAPGQACHHTHRARPHPPATAAAPSCPRTLRPTSNRSLTCRHACTSSSLFTYLASCLCLAELGFWTRIQILLQSQGMRDVRQCTTALNSGIFPAGVLLI